METSIKGDSSSGEEQSSSSSSKQSTSGLSGTNSTVRTTAPGKGDEWPAITLQCTPFSHGNEAKRKKQHPSGTHHPHPLYITVALVEGKKTRPPMLSLHPDGLS